MAPGNKQPKWNIHEAVILLDGYLETLHDNCPKLRVVKRVSADLRQMAINRGLTIDDTYRNENGISYQIQSMDSAYKGKKVYVPSTKLFDEAVVIYREEPQRYYEILEEAKKMIAAKQNSKEAFMVWAASTFPSKRCKWLEDNILKIERFALASKIISGSIFEETNPAVLETIYRTAGKNKLFQIRNRKLIKNINEDFKAYIKFCSIKPTAETSSLESIIDEANTSNGQIIEQPEDDTCIVNFAIEQSMAFTKPRSISFHNTELAKPSTWKDVYVEAISVLYEKHPGVFDSLRSFPGSSRLEFGTISDENNMTAPRKVSEELFIETNFSATDFIKRIKTLLSLCGEDYSALSIRYSRRSDAASKSTAVSVIPNLSANNETEFYAYLKNVAQLADKTCSSYISSIRSAEHFAKKNGYEFCSLFDDDKEIIAATATELYGDPEFVRYNEQQHNRFSTAINKMLEFIGTPIPEKAVVSVGFDRMDTSSKSEINEDIIKVLKQYYEYGFKYDSIRELMRFRQFADEIGVELPEEDIDLKDAILASGTVIDDRVYCKSDDMPFELQRIIDDIFSSGVGVIYYDSLFQDKSEWMENHVIVSSDMLKEYLQKNVSGCSFSKQFMVKGNRRSEKEAVTSELQRVWGASPAESVYNLHNRLPYIPLRNIWRVISGNDMFVLVSKGEYLFIDRFIITEDEEEDILDFVEATCEYNGFASLSDVPLGGIEEENYELTQLAIYNAIYKKVLSGKYHLNGKIITKEKSELDAVALLKQYIKEKNECAFDDVAEKVVELTGGTNRQYAFQALYDDMVRVDKNRFVANRFVNFNVDEIDAALSGFITDNFRAIRDVTTFAMFPICGQSWNHYLLESFCYKYSRKYSLHVIHFNDKNAGIIAEKDFNKSYNEMLAIALSRSDIELVPAIIGQYLFNTGYMAKSKYAKLDEIAQRASELRKER